MKYNSSAVSNNEEYIYSESESSVPSKFEDYFHDWMTIRTLLCFLLPFDGFDLNIASLDWSVSKITIGAPFLGNHNE